MQRIKELRLKNGESQTELAKIVGVSLRTIQNYESGNVDVPYKSLEKIAQHYDVTVAYLFDEVYDEIPEELFESTIDDPLQHYERLNEKINLSKEIVYLKQLIESQNKIIDLLTEENKRLKNDSDNFKKNPEPPTRF